MARATDEIAPKEVAKHLRGLLFPANKADLLEHAKDQDADEKVLSAIEEMPDHDYRDMADVMKGFGAAHT